MASPQTGNGFTRIANELLEEIVKFKFNGTEFRIIMTIWRYTYGFNRKSHALSTSFIALAVGIDNSRVRKVLKKLIDMNVISVLKEATFNESRVLEFNKNYAGWGVESESRGQEEPHSPKTAQPEGSNNTQPQGVKRTQPEGSNTTPKKDMFKDSIKESIKDNRKPVVLVDKSFGEIISFYETNVGLISPHVSQELGFLFDENGSDLVLSALQKSVEAKAKNIVRYMQGILKNWVNANVKTLEDINKLDALPRKSSEPSMFDASPETLERQRRNAEKYKNHVVDTSDLPY